MADNSIFVGSKPFMNYVTAVVMQFTTQNAEEVIIKARGKFIARGVDIAEVAAKRFLEGKVAVKDIHIDSDEFQNNEGKQVRVSTIEITLERRGNLPSMDRGQDAGYEDNQAGYEEAPAQEPSAFN